MNVAKDLTGKQEYQGAKPTLKVVINESCLEDLEREDLYHLVEHYKKLSQLDDVTELFNYRRLQLDLHRLVRQRGEFSLLFMDVDGLKQVNDENGHLVGTCLLQLLAKKLKKLVQKQASIYRYGGDEFIILCPQMSREDALLWARDLNANLVKEQFCVSLEGENELTFSLSLSTGVAAFPLDGKTVKDLVMLADKMMYESKKERKNQIGLTSEFVISKDKE